MASGLREVNEIANRRGYPHKDHHSHGRTQINHSLILGSAERGLQSHRYNARMENPTEAEIEQAAQDCFRICTRYDLNMPNECTAEYAGDLILHKGWSRADANAVRAKALKMLRPK